jgi:Flp pilus assembly protein TadG
MNRLLKNRGGSAAAEMALSLPLLLVLLFGCFETGTYFWSEHIAMKGVRDGARYAARQPVDALGCGPAVSNAAVETNIKNVTRTGQVAGGTARIRGWTNSQVSVAVACQTTPSGIYSSGIYTNLPSGARIVTVSAAVPYPSLFGALGINTSGLNVRASAQAAVMGI